ncbi:hypothetical protein [Evansella clarkii]|uniref:hypothetical protein n=1 Tax=Evansella clarkii TaxID=79879 RepID=UPI001F33B4A6|nr:hypothetical protein [Evansella clarkii]
MREDRGKYFNELVSMQKKLTEEGIAYWQLYSDFSSWQFWVCLLMLLYSECFPGCCFDSSCCDARLPMDNKQ